MSSVWSSFLFIPLVSLDLCRFFCRGNSHITKRPGILKPISMDGIITLTVLLLLDLVYVLFVAIQFKYFFSGTLGDGYTYAEYARRGFFELLFVTLINLTVTTVVIHCTKHIQGLLKGTDPGGLDRSCLIKRGSFDISHHANDDV